jgi:hypothetical protein
MDEPKIPPQGERSERRSSDDLLADLAAVSALAARLRVDSPAGDFDAHVVVGGQDVRDDGPSPARPAS